ncbi:SIS domain-containing protein [Amycolatopsis sp. WQ 127309]|uniref:SIS domain-containing protein n=1 Tax=Amycolatopsis sp. WQ 127309 TaxID=2932773 RepID=UPI001FF461A8|nr:SIS domain-containing protein [Amycolatopsis sp. WQ 127309]UOZ11996.1 SIS domain-containing protein [Amycolatopsis sp. WQ 127309]
MQEKQPGRSRTAGEIRQQPDAWRQVARTVAEARSGIDRLLGEALADPRARVVLTGAGTSAFAGEVLAPDLARHLGRPVEPIATTDIVADPRSVVVADRPVLLVSFARSGDSPESVAAADLLGRLAPALHHVVVTCNASGALARQWSDTKNGVVIALPDALNDRGFAMTSSFTGMVLATLLAFGVDVDVETAADAAATLLDTAEHRAAAIAATEPARLVYLGSGAFKGLAHEAALKCLELTAGRVVAVADTPLGFRHGPKSVLDEETIAVVFPSGDPYTRAYDDDITRELVASLGSDRVLVIGAESESGDARTWPIPGIAGLPDAARAIVAAIPAQSIALACALARGLPPDNPFPGGEVNRVVRGVVIHAFPNPAEG